jgi:stress response protein YsnF
MAKSVVGLFDEKTNIDSVIRDLERIGIPKRHVHALARADAREGVGRSWTERVAAFFGFTGEARERELGAAYADAMNEGDTLLIVDVEDPMADRTAAVLNQYGAIDVSGRTPTRAETSAADATAIPTTAAAPEARTIPEPPVSRTVPVTAQTTVPVIQEELEVGKRIVDRGGVRVHSHVEEMPVEEVIRLREEHVEVERRAVDRPVNAADAFEEVTLEVTETAEEPVVAKQARVVEEVIVGKTAEEHEETIEGTVRRQDVDVEPLPKTGTGGRR